jgi:hypothetical protein
MPTLDSSEPPNGDFVAFVEKIEREQLARAMQPHTPLHLDVAGQAVSQGADDGKARPLGAPEAQRALQMLKTQGTDRAAAPRGALIGAFLGAALVAFGLLAEGGIFLVLVGAVLLWHSLRKLRRTAAAATASPGRQVDAVFGRTTPSATRKRSG